MTMFKTVGVDNVERPATTPIIATGLVRRHGPPSAPPILRGIDLVVGAGEWVAVMGPSGCGKSTLLHLLGGLDQPDEGTVHLAGHALGAMSEAARARLRRRHVGYVFQFFNLMGHLDVVHNVALAARLAGEGRSTALRRAGVSLEAVGMGGFARQRVTTLSGGEQQRVAVARALVTSPTVLLADEPTGALDTDAARTVIEALRTAHLAGQTSVMVTHDHRVAASADRVVFMQDGSIIDERRLAGSEDDPSRTSFAHLIPLDPW